METSLDVYVDYGIEKGQVWVHKKYTDLKLKIAHYQPNSYCLVYELDSSLNPQSDFVKTIMLVDLLKTYEKFV